VDWETLCRSKKNSGLGIGRMVDKGMSLLAKWIWRFGREESTLWKKVLCAKYGLGSSPLKWDGLRVKHGSSFFFAVCRFFVDDHRAYNIVSQGFQVVVGCGHRVQLWKEICWDSVPLQATFPRIFALASNKVGVVKEFGRWDNNKWVWEVNLRRPLFDWEVNQWNSFVVALNNINVGKILKILWHGLSLPMAYSRFDRSVAVWKSSEFVIIWMIRYCFLCGREFVHRK
jgi:hypothetical protein